MAECYDQFPEHVRQLYRINYGYLVRVRVRVRLGLGFRSGQSQCVPPFRSVPEIIPTLQQDWLLLTNRVTRVLYCLTSDCGHAWTMVIFYFSK